MAFSDKIDPEDHAWMSLSRAPELEQMPAALLCPAGHRAYRVILELQAPGVPTVRAPIYGCVSCQVGYRYQECALPPGEEGLPDSEPA